MIPGIFITIIQYHKCKMYLSIYAIPGFRSKILRGRGQLNGERGCVNIGPHKLEQGPTHSKFSIALTLGGNLHTFENGKSNLLPQLGLYLSRPTKLSMNEVYQITELNSTVSQRLLPIESARDESEG